MMFDNVGKELKFYAQLSVWVSVIIFGLLGWHIGEVIATALHHNRTDIDGVKFVAGLCSLPFGAFFGYLVGRLIAVWHYAFAEMVDCAVKVQAFLEQQGTHAAQNEPVCEKCGFRYPEGANWCSNCGAKLQQGVTDDEMRAEVRKRLDEMHLFSDEEC